MSPSFTWIYLTSLLKSLLSSGFMELHSIFSRMIEVIFIICLCLFWLPIAPPYTWWDVAGFLNWHSRPCSGCLLSTVIASLITKKNQTAHNSPCTPWHFMPFTLLIGLKTIYWSFKFYFNRLASLDTVKHFSFHIITVPYLHLLCFCCFYMTL